MKKAADIVYGKFNGSPADMCDYILSRHPTECLIISIKDGALHIDWSNMESKTKVLGLMFMAMQELSN